MKDRLVLGIETSCDDTSVAVVAESGRILSSVRINQDKIHEKFGGVYPEFASRAHIFNIIPCVDEALEKSGVTVNDLEAIGVTSGPGLVGSLLVGINTATALGRSWQKPVIGINHLRGHVRSVELEEAEITYPSLMLLISGGHTMLCFMQSRDEFSVLGETRDDSLGEAYDKVGRMIGLSYPAGPMMDKLADSGSPTIKFPRPLLREGYEFSFAGLKSSVRRYLEKNPDYVQEDVAASFAASVIDILSFKLEKAVQEFAPKGIIMVGGVAASPPLRKVVQDLCDDHQVSLFLPPIKWSTDNAAMIALATFDYLNQGIDSPPTPRYRLPVNAF